jgi:hypothetical protein
VDIQSTRKYFAEVLWHIVRNMHQIFSLIACKMTMPTNQLPNIQQGQCCAGCWRFASVPALPM